MHVLHLPKSEVLLRALDYTTKRTEFGEFVGNNQKKCQSQCCHAHTEFSLL